MSKAKKLFEPQSNLELLRGWLIHAHKGRDRHDLASRVYERARYVIGAPAVILSTVVGSAVFSALKAKEAPDGWVVALSVLAAAFSALQTFLDFPARAERHRTKGVKYKVIIRLLEQTLVDMANGSPPGENAVASFRAQFDSLEEDAPVIMPRIFDAIERRYSRVTYVQEALELYH